METRSRGEVLKGQGSLGEQEKPSSEYTLYLFLDFLLSIVFLLSIDFLLSISFRLSISISLLITLRIWQSLFKV